jgi:NaMN:DMB phosphoribosyltransferase
VGGEREVAEWGVREGVGAGGEMTQALYAHMNNKTIKKPQLTIEKKKKEF